jgi:gamma-glutamyl:cysteine ligase YbdK (ATP-grasp superfamily)
VNAPPRAQWPVHEERLLKWFAYDHLPADLQGVSKLFHALAHELTLKLQAGPERTVALRKLLEAKDSACRQAIEDRT